MGCADGLLTASRLASGMGVIDMGKGRCRVMLGKWRNEKGRRIVKGEREVRGFH